MVKLTYNYCRETATCRFSRICSATDKLKVCQLRMIAIKSICENIVFTIVC